MFVSSNELSPKVISLTLLILMFSEFSKLLTLFSNIPYASAIPKSTHKFFLFSTDSVLMKFFSITLFSLFKIFLSSICFPSLSVTKPLLFIIKISLLGSKTTLDSYLASKILYDSTADIIDN